MSSTLTDPSTALAALIDARYSCRAFLPEPVDRATLERLVALVRRSPSWCNTQPWHLHVTEGAGTERLRRELTAFGTTTLPAPDLEFPPRYDGVFRDRRRACASALYESVGIAADDRAASMQQTFKNFELFGAPHLAILTSERALGVYGAVDCGVYLGNLLLAAQSLGLATIPQAAIAACSPVVRRELGLPDSRIVICGMSFGYADPDEPVNAFRTERAPAADGVTWVTE